MADTSKEKEHSHRTGSEKIVSDSSYPAPELSGSTSANELARSNELLSVMLDSVDGIIFVADIDTHEILFANSYLKNLFGFDPVGKKCCRYVHAGADNQCGFCSNYQFLNEHGVPSPPHFSEFQNPFTQKWYRAKDQAIRWYDGRYVGLEVAVDITEQKRLSRFLAEARRQARMAGTIHSRFVALVAHDLKSPFYSMTQMLKRILERETFAHTIHREFLENIVENGQRMLHMIDNLLTMDRLKQGDLSLDWKFFDVSQMADEVVSNFRHAAYEKNITLVNAIPRRTKLYGDRYLMFVVLNNLVSNGIKFSRPGGGVELCVPTAGRSMTVSVRDSGSGMSREAMQNLFQGEAQTSVPGTRGESGSGLGLLFCRDIIAAHHGAITVDSAPGEGTEFRVELPECCALGIEPDGSQEND
jgi:signal transduction histidine kinase